MACCIINALSVKRFDAIYISWNNNYVALSSAARLGTISAFPDNIKWFKK
jgi:hypothetical protein